MITNYVILVYASKVEKISMSIAWAGSPLVGSFLNAKYGFKGLFLGTTAGYFIALGWLVCFFSYKKEYKIEKPPLNNSINAENVIQKRYSIISIAVYFIVFALLQIINSLLNTNLPLYITNTLGEPSAYAGIIASFSALVEIPIMILLAGLSIKFGYKKLISLGMVCGLIFLSILLFITDIYLIIFIHVLKSIFIASFMSLGIPFFQNMIPKHHGISTVLFMNTTRIGSIASGLIIGLLGKNYLKTFSTSIAICGIAIIIFIVVNYFEGEKQ